jgi:predicted AlkP superfamily phosphohydrolase/phosphomutase
MLYIGPGAGFAFLGSFLTLLLGILASIASMLIWPFRLAWLTLRRKRGSHGASVKKIIFLGLDGLDPSLTEKFIAAGKLPHLAKLRDGGSYRRLRTTFPPLSPVAWSTFATGVNPARHNIFDFLNRDLRTYAPELSSSKVRPGSVEMRRKSEPFWKILGRHAITSTILRVPITFPPDDFEGKMLSAMATPDLRGTQGTFSVFTNGGDGGENRYPLQAVGEAWQGSLRGPDDRRVAFRILHGILELHGQRYPLQLGEYTPWIRVKFEGVHGIVRFLLTQSAPHLSVYATPVQIDPESPALPISHPRYYAIYLAKLLGTFATLGMAEDTWALNDGAIDEDAFLKQAAFIQREREAMYFGALEKTRRGVVACVFDTSDRVQHMFYRYLDPASGAAMDVRHSGVIERLYIDMDRLVGETLKYVDKDCALFVLSDHGFCAFRRGVNLNAWLRREGYLHLTGQGDESGEYFEGIDWSRTRAYTFGLSGLYLNLRARESQGIVAPEDACALKRELMAKLSALPDEETGAVAIQAVYESSVIYKGPYLGGAPDLIIGYAAGYRASWDAAVGKVTAHVFEHNDKAWSGDHCVDPHLVPGVLFSNRPLSSADPGIEDMAPTALRLFGIEPPVWMEGKAVAS